MSKRVAHESFLPRMIRQSDVLRGEGDVRWAVVLSSGYVVSFASAVEDRACLASHVKDGACCTRLEGHLGPHVSVEFPTATDDHGAYGHVLAIWPSLRRR